MKTTSLLKWAFFVQPVALGAWFPRIPEMQKLLEIDKAELAIGLLGLPAGILVSVNLASRIIEKLGPRRTTIIGFILFLLAIPLPAMASSLWQFFTALAIVGAANAVTELGLNIQADVTERATGKHIMTTCHGFWSLGIMTGSGVGTLFWTAGLAPYSSQVICVALVAAPSIILVWRLPDLPMSESIEPKSRHRIMPAPALLAICLFVFGVAMTEGAMADWSTLLLADEFGAAASTAGFAYTAFAACVAVGRFAGDPLRVRFGAVLLARLAGALAIIGIALLGTAPNLTLAYSGLGLTGLGVSLGFPLAVTAVASAPGRSPAANVAFLTQSALAAFLAGPPLIGFAAEAWGLRTGICLLLPLLLLSLALAGSLAASATVAAQN